MYSTQCTVRSARYAVYSTQYHCTTRVRCRRAPLSEGPPVRSGLAVASQTTPFTHEAFSKVQGIAYSPYCNVGYGGGRV